MRAWPPPSSAGHPASAVAQGPIEDGRRRSASVTQSPARSPASSALVASLSGVPGRPSGYSGWSTASVTGPAAKASTCSGGEGEPHIVDGRGGLGPAQVGLVLLLRRGVDDLGRRIAPDAELDRALDADQAGQPGPELLLGGELEEQCGRQLAGAGSSRL